MSSLSKDSEVRFLVKEITGLQPKRLEDLAVMVKCIDMDILSRYEMMGPGGEIDDQAAIKLHRWYVEYKKSV